MSRASDLKITWDLKHRNRFSISTDMSGYIIATMIIIQLTIGDCSCGSGDSHENIAGKLYIMSN